MRTFDGIRADLEATREPNARQDRQGAGRSGARLQGGSGSVSTFLTSISPVPDATVPPIPKSAGGEGPPLPQVPPRATNPDSVSVVLRAIEAGHQDATALVANTGLAPGALLAVLQGQVFVGTVYDVIDDDGTRHFRLTEAGRRLMQVATGE